MRDDEEMCCQFDPYPGDDGEPYQYRRTCDVCGNVWWANHCPHDGIQTPCRECGWRPPGTRSPLEALGFKEVL